MNRITQLAACVVLLLTEATSCVDAQPDFGTKIEQTSIGRVDLMPNLPAVIEIMDWEAKARAFDAFVFDWNKKDGVNPLIWLDDNRRNIDQTTFGIYTALKDIRQGRDVNNGEFHESLNSLAALLGAGLIGIDKTNQHGYNYVKMVQNYFNKENRWNIVMNNTHAGVALLGGGYGRDWWYDVFPNVLYYAVCDVFPGVNGADEIQRTIAEQFVKADSILNGNYDYSYFDYAQMKGVVNNLPLQQDAAGGHAYVLLCAYHKFGDVRYLKHAKSAVEALLSQKESRFYEILLPLGVYAAAYLNATEGTNYNVQKLLDWTFDGCQHSDARYGWGVITGKWGDHEVNGLQGSTKDGGGYGFLMNSIKLSWPFVPMVKYQPQYARAIGKWMLNNVNACRLYFPLEIDSEHQWAPELKNITNNIIAYEGLRKEDDYGKEQLKGISPVALGDGPKWIKGNPVESMFSVYSTSPVGIFGAIVKKTNVEGILQLDCNATDFYTERPYPVFLYYNPYTKNQSVSIDTEEIVDLFDIVNKEYVGRSVFGKATFDIPADAARVLVVLPIGTKVREVDSKILAGNNNVIAYK